ncbi:MAG TPA: hypothetical protein VII52_00270, partial [Gemmatimonadaceae bacterium]
MSESILLTDSDQQTLDEAVAHLEGWQLDRVPAAELMNAIASHTGVRVVVVSSTDPTILRSVTERAHGAGIPVVVACADDTARRRAVELKAEEWYRCPADSDEIAQRVRSAVARGLPDVQAIADRVERVEYEQMLHDSLTGLPTLPVMIERSRSLFKERGELVVLYLNFVRYSKIEEIYGWEILDAVLETTAAAVREFLDDTAMSTSRLMVSFTNDDDFIFFHVPATGVAAASDNDITDMVARLQRHVGARIEASHGEDIAALFDIYVGR